MAVLIFFEAKIIFSKPEMIVSKPEITFATPTNTAWVPDMSATLPNKTATVTEKIATMATNTATITKMTASIGLSCKSQTRLTLDGIRKYRYDRINNYLRRRNNYFRPGEDRSENAISHWRRNNNHVNAGFNLLKLTVNQLAAEVTYAGRRVNRFRAEIDYL